MLDFDNHENAEFKEFLKEEKIITDTTITFPSMRNSEVIKARGLQSNQQFLLDINRKSMRIQRITYQNRIPTSIILLRLDIDTKPHRNPNGEIIRGTHLHIFDKNDSCGSWAFELNDPRLQNFFPEFDFSRFNEALKSNFITCFTLFCELNHITEIPVINNTLFS